jgi:hypothetical protein
MSQLLYSYKIPPTRKHLYKEPIKLGFGQMNIDSKMVCSRIFDGNIGEMEIAGEACFNVKRDDYMSFKITVRKILMWNPSD